MEIISVLLVVKEDFKYSDLIISNIENAGCKCELLVFNNGCSNTNELNKLKEYSNNFLGSSDKIFPLGECLNQLISSTRNEYYFIINSYGFYEKNWGIDFISEYNRILNAGVFSIAEKSTEINYAFSKTDELIECFIPENLDENIFFSKKQIENIGGFDSELDGAIALRNYSERIKKSGFINLQLSKTYFLKIFEYTSHLFLSEEDYQKKVKKLYTNKNFLKHSDPLYHQVYFETDKVKEIIEDLNKCLKHSFKVYFNDIQGVITILKDNISGLELQSILNYCSLKSLKINVKPSLMSFSSLNKSILIIDVIY
jgi:hypothetical protein